MSQVLVGALSSLPGDTGTCVDVDGTAVAVFRVDRDVFAIANRCSHAEASDRKSVV
jgi:nitrite reductase/ring-hydroxylating ferredoxin subunit